MSLKVGLGGWPGNDVFSAHRMNRLLCFEHRGLLDVHLLLLLLPWISSSVQ